MAGAGSQSSTVGRGLLIGFVAGVVAVAVFHQLSGLLLGFVGLSEGTFYSFRPTAPFGVPRVMSQMFWGGVWGVVFAAVVNRLRRRWPIVVVGFVFSLCGPVLFGWLVVAAIRGEPLMGGFVPLRMLSSVLINGSFGIGLALIFAWLRRVAEGRPRTM
jgi:hypothetical protein